MKFGIIYDDVDRQNLDCSKPEKGNPGVGGTQYCYLMLIYYMKRNHDDVEIVVYRHRNTDLKAILPYEECVRYKVVQSLKDCVVQAHEDKVDVLLFTADHVLELSLVIAQYMIKSMVWIHNWIRGEILDEITKNYWIRRAIFLVPEHYDRYIDDDVIDKAIVISNMFNCEGYELRDYHCKNVTYVGALVEAKGFGALAKAWKNVLKKEPEANLYVIGKGTLYSSNSKMGQLGIADVKFENKFRPYISDSNGQILPSVHFLGLLGKEKTEIYKNTMVGIVNPTGRTEVCPVSALEMEAAGIPIVSRNKNGIPDVVKNKQTGILIHRESKLADAIVLLLHDEKINNMYGYNARKYVEEAFNPNSIIDIWYKTIIDVKNEVPVQTRKTSGNYWNNCKIIRIFNAKLRKMGPLSKIPSIIKFESYISNKLRGH